MSASDPKRTKGDLAALRHSSRRNPHEKNGAAKEQGEKDDEVSDTLDHLVALRAKSPKAKLLPLTWPLDLWMRNRKPTRPIQTTLKSCRSSFFCHLTSRFEDMPILGEAVKLICDGTDCRTGC